MKYLLILLAVLVGFGLWHNRRRETLRDHAARKAPPPQLQNMVHCAVCGVHLPASEAIRVRAGVFCCPEHRDQSAGH